MSDDPFADVRGFISGQGYGALGGAGAESHHSVKVSRDPEKKGMNYQSDCDNCGQTNVVTVMWDEFIYGAAGLVPPNWVYDRAHGGIHPNVGCRRCKGLMLLLFSPDECGRQLKSGVAAQHIDERYVVQASQAVRQRAQQQHG